MKNVIFNILTVLILLATVGVGAVYAAVLFSGGGPDLSSLSSLAAAPPPPLPTSIVLPTTTATARKLAPTWTETANALATYDASRKLGTGTPIPAGSVVKTATEYSIPSITPIPSATLVPTPTDTPVTPTLTYTSTYTVTNTYTPYPTSSPYPTSTPRPTDNLTLTALAQMSIQNSVTAQALTLQVIQIYQTQTFAAQTAQASAAPTLTAAAQAALTQTAVQQTLVATSQSAAQTATATMQAPTFAAQTQTQAVLNLPGNPSNVNEPYYSSNNLNSGDWQSGDNSPTFQWFNPNGATAYYIYWGINANGTNDFAAPVAIGGASPFSFTPPGNPIGATPGVTYYLRVRTKFGSLERGNYDTIFIYRYDKVAPNNPTSASVSGASDGVWQNSVTSPTFSMNGATDPGGSGNMVYRFAWLSTGATPSSPLPNGPSATYNPGNVADGIYYLWAQAQDSAGNLNTNPVKVFTFKLDTTAPGVPNMATLLIAPAPATDQDHYQHNTPAFTWTDVSDPGTMSGFKNYDIYWGTDSNPTDTTVTIVKTIATFDVGDPPSVPMVNATYYLRVRSRDNAGNTSAWSSMYHLTYTGP
jgi:hypothetical protein